MDDKTHYKEITSSLRFLCVVVASLSVLCLLLTGGSCYSVIQIQAHQTSISILQGSNARLIEEVGTLKEWKSNYDEGFEVPKTEDAVKSQTLHKAIKNSLQKKEVLSGQGQSLTELLNAVQSLRGPPGSPGLPGKDGENGADGKDGADGADGKDGRDAVNFYAVDRHINATIKTLADQEMTRVRLAANEISQVSGAVYTRWGRTVCPSPSDLVMKGIAAGSNYSTQGGAAEYICLPDDPDWTSTTLPSSYSKISGVEYESSVFKQGSMWNQNAPCAICQTNGRSALKMFPAKSRCPDSTWTVEFVGFLMTEYGTHHRTQYVCVDASPEAIPGEAHDTNGAVWYHVVADCTAGYGALGACPPYNSNSVLSCIVCSK